MRDEFEALEVPFDERGQRTDEYIDLLRLLWRSPAPVDFEGRFVTVRNMGLPAQPVTPGGPPVLVGGNTAAAARRVAARGDGWVGADLDAGHTRAFLRRLEEELKFRGRSLDGLVLSMRKRIEPGTLGTGPGRFAGVDAGALAEDLRALADVGVTLAVLDLLMLPNQQEAVDWLAELVLPAIGPSGRS
jgi:hypothetical protein